MLKTKIILLSSALIFSLSSIAAAQDVISTDISVVTSSGSIIEDQAIAQTSGANADVIVTDLGLPSAVDIAALHFIDDTTVLFTLKTAAQLGAVSTKTGDVMQWREGVITKVVSGSQLGLNPATGIDALTQSGDALVFSTTIADVINGVPISSSDLLTWTEGGLTELFLDQSVCGITHETNLSGVHLTDTGHLLMAFSSATMVGGVPSRKGDIVRCDPGTNSVTPYRQYAGFGEGWAAMSIDAISQSLDERIFFDGFEELLSNR